MATFSTISLFLALALICIIGPVRAQSPTVTLYQGINLTGANVRIGANYVPDLSVYSFNNMARSACVTGIWLFYDFTNYNTGVNQGMEYVFGNNYCVNLEIIAGLTSSIRYAGTATDFKSSTMTFYEETYFQGSEEYAVGSLPNLSLNGRIKSLIVTGSPTEGWTVYDQPNYAGNAACIFPPNTPTFDPALIYDTIIITFPHGAIASVRKGCLASRTVAVETKRHGYQKVAEIEQN